MRHQFVIYLYLCAILLVLASCVKEAKDLSVPHLAGMWAQVNDDKTVAKLIEFKDGAYIEYTHKGDEKLYSHDAKVWHSTIDDFIGKRYQYTLAGRNLILSNSETLLSVSVKDDKLYLEGIEYQYIKELDAAYGSVISLPDSESKGNEFSPYAQEVRLEYDVSNIPKDTLLHVSCFADWIKSISIDENYINFTIEENLTSGIRNANVVLHHPAANSVEIEIIQLVSKLNISSPLTRTDYSISKFEFAYSIESPHEGETVEVLCPEEWITDLVLRDNRVFFTVLENNSGVPRATDIVLEYGALTAMHRVEQSYVAPEIRLSEMTTSISSFGASHSFLYEILNPRQIEEVKVLCAETWISNIVIEENRVSFDVLENKTGVSRIADIVLQYVSTQSIYKVVQSYTYPEVIQLDLDDKAQSSTVKLMTAKNWVSRSYEDWLSVTPENGTNIATVAISVTENYTDKERVGIVMVSDGTVDYIIKVIQSGKYFSFTIDNSTIESKEKNISITLLTNDGWKIVKPDNVNWLTFSKSQGKGDMNITVAVCDNPSITSRECIITIKLDNLPEVQFKILQYGRYLNVGVSQLNFSALGGSESIAIETDGVVTISSSSDWIQITQIAANTFTIGVSRNKSVESRSGKVTVSLSDLKDGSERSVNIEVNQKGVSEVFDGSDYPTDEDWN